MKRIGLAGLIAMRAPLLLLDEPKAYLDPAAAEHFTELVRRLNEDLGYTFVIVTHDMDFAAQVASRIVVLNDGAVEADGSARAILTDEALLKRARLEPPLLTRLFSNLDGSGLASDEIPITAAEAASLLAKRKLG
jgi:ABC-type transporter Mla maintaining outer membrane lipid asymmetry ATPase subunit MlaF